MKKFVAVNTVKGDIISEMYEPDLKAYIVKWDHGIQQFNHIIDVLSMPRWDVSTLARKPFMNRGGNHLGDWFYRHLVLEVRYGFEFIKPQGQTRKYVDEFYPHTGWINLVLKVKPPHTLQKVPLKTFPQSIYKRFNRWYYDDKTSEAVVVFRYAIKMEF